MSSLNKLSIYQLSLTAKCTFAVSICSTLVVTAPGIWRLLFHTLLKISFAKLHQVFFLTPALSQLAIKVQIVGMVTKATPTR